MSEYAGFPCTCDACGCAFNWWHPHKTRCVHHPVLKAKPRVRAVVVDGMTTYVRV